MRLAAVCAYVVALASSIHLKSEDSVSDLDTSFATADVKPVDSSFIQQETRGMSIDEFKGWLENLFDGVAKRRARILQEVSPSRS